MPICWSSPGSRARVPRRSRASMRLPAGMWRARSSRRSSRPAVRASSRRRVTDPAWKVRRRRARRRREAIGLSAPTSRGSWRSPSGCGARQRRIARGGLRDARRRDRWRQHAAGMAQAIAEGLTLAEFDGGSYKTREHDVCAPPAWTIVAGGRRGSRPRRRRPRSPEDGCSASAATWRAGWPTNRATR